MRAPSTSVSHPRDVGVTRPPVFAPEEMVSGAPAPLAAPDDVGRLGVWRLKRMWSRSDAIRRGLATEPYGEVRDDHLVLDAIGLGFEQASVELMRCTSFPRRPFGCPYRLDDPDDVPDKPDQRPTMVTLALAPRPMVWANPMRASGT